MKRSLLYSALSLVFLSLSMRAQDANFSQFYANPLYLNPALAGVSKCPRVSLNYRNLHPELNIYNTYSASYDQYVESLNGGIGFLVMRDDAGNGTFTNTDISAMYSYHLKASRKFTVLAGFQATYKQVSLDWSNLVFPDQIDPFYGTTLESNEVAPNNLNVGVVDVSAGIIGYTEKFYFGLAAHHLTQPDVSFFVQDRLPMKFTGHAGLTIPLGRQRIHGELVNYLIPNIVFQQQGPFNQFTGNISFRRSAISGGLGFRTSTVNPDAIIALIGFTPEDMPFSVGYSYDFTIGAIAGNLGGAHEISLSYRFPCRTPRKKIKAINCPQF